MARDLTYEVTGMFIDRLFNQGSEPLLEQTLRFTAARHKLIAQNVVNISTPGYQQKDLSVARFQQLLAQRAEVADRSTPGTVSYDDIGTDVENSRQGVLFHDG